MTVMLVVCILVAVVTIFMVFVLCYRVFSDFKATEKEFLKKFPEMRHNRGYLLRLFDNTVKDKNGYLYVIKERTQTDTDASAIDEMRAYLFKVGRTSREIIKRVKELANANNKEYIVLRKVKTSAHITFEVLMHKILKNYKVRMPRGAGFKEWFNVSLRTIDDHIGKVKEHLEYTRWFQSHNPTKVFIPILLRGNS